MKVNQSKKRFVKTSVSAALVASSISSIVVPTSAATFSDLSQANPHYQNIINLLERGIVNGFPDGTYRPNEAVTRGQAAKILANLLNLDLKDLPNLNFTDVNENNHYYPYIAALVKAGIISGYSDQTFKPNNTITRGQMAKMIALGFNLQATTEANFSDVPRTHQFASYVNALFSANVTTGKTATTFDLAGSVTRGQLASFVVRAEKAQEQKISHVSSNIEKINKKTIVISGKSYTVHKDVAFLLNAANLDALQNAELTFTAQGTEIVSVSSLTIHNGSQFNGLNASIDTLKLASSVTALKNVQSNTIQYTVNADTKIENVQANKLIATADYSKVAATTNTFAPIDITINGSQFEIVELIGSVIALQKTATTVTNLVAENVSSLQLNGDYQNVMLAALTNLTGNAIIEKLQFSNGNIKQFKPNSSIKINNITINGNSMTWEQAVQQYLQPSLSETPSNSNDVGYISDIPTPVVPSAPDNNGNSEQTPPPIEKDKDGQAPGDNEDEDELAPDDNKGEDELTPDDNKGEDELTPDDNKGEDELTPDDNKGEDELTPDDNKGENEGDTNSSIVPTPLAAENINISANFDKLSGSTAATDSGAKVTVYNAQKQLLGQDIVQEDGTFTVALTSADSTTINIKEGDQLTIVVDKAATEAESNVATQNQLIWTVPAKEEVNTGEGNVPAPTDPITPPATSPATTGPVSTSDFSVVGNTVQMTNTETNETVSYTIADSNIQSFLSANLSALTNVQLNVSEGEVTAITAATITDAGAFNGEVLHNVAIETLTLTTVTSVENIHSVDHLIVNSDSSTLAFQNVSANITAIGNFTEITGASGDQLTIQSTAPNVLVSNITSSNINIEENHNVARQFVTKRVASLNKNFIAASETKMQITFADGDYSSKTLNINRKDTTVNVSGAPFSNIQINSDNVDLYTSGNEINRLTISNKVSYLAIDANVTTFDVTVGQPLTIHSSSPSKTIDSLNITAAAGATNMIDLVNVTVGTATLNNSPITDNPITSNPIFKQETTIPGEIPEFSSALERVSFGKYKINIEDIGTFKLIELKDPSQLSTFKQLTTLTGVQNVKDYTSGAEFIYYADVSYIIVYKVDAANTVLGYSVVSAPSNTSNIRLNGISEAGEINYQTRFSDTQTPSSVLNTIYVFKSGSLAKEVAVPTNAQWTKQDNLNSIKINTGVSFNYTREAILANNTLISYGMTVANNPDDYVNILKVAAKKAADKNNPMLIQPVLKFVFSMNSAQYDSAFLTKYVTAINEKASSLTALSDFENLISTIDGENAYDPSISLEASDLYLTGKISSSFTYSKDGVVTNTINDSNELLFNAKSQGTTTLRVTDSNGLATLVNVTVGADNKITTEVLATDAPAGTFIEGASNFRYSGSKLIATTLEKSAAIINTGSALTRVTLTPNGTAYALSAAQTLKTETVSPTVFGLNTITSISGDNVGFYKDNDQFVLFARYEGTELVLVTDDTNTTALNAITTTEITDFATSIAKSNSLNINGDLNLLSTNSEVFAPSNTKNVFLYNDGATITAFANSAFKGSIKLTDSTNAISIVNVEATKNSNEVNVASFKEVKTSLAEQKDANGNVQKDGSNNPIVINNGASVQKIDVPVVRANGLDLYAIAVGTATVTLTNGKQYQVTVTADNGTYSIKEKEMQNLTLNASDLHMKDITSVIGTSSYEVVNNGSEVIITLPSTPGTLLTLVSSNNEKALINVTRDDTGQYNHTVYRSELLAAAAGLDKITEVYNAGTPPLQIGARAKAADDKLYIYNLDTKQHAFRVSNGTLSTLVNVDVTADGSGFKSEPKAVFHEVKDLTIDTTKEIVGTGARLVGNTLYATGEGFNGSNTATVKVPLVGGSYYVININYNADTGLYNFDTEGTVTFTESFTKEQLGLRTITNARTDAVNMTATTANDIVTVAITKNTEGRIEVTGTDAQGQQAQTFIYIKRDENGVTKNIERAEASANVAFDLDLTNYGYTATPTGSWSVDGIGRATISSALKLNIYAQDVGQSLYTLTDGNGKDLLIHAVVGADNPRVTTAKVIEADISTDATLTGSIISVDGIRLSADSKKVYATKEDGKATLKLTNADNSITKYVAYSVVKNGDGSYEINPTELANASVTLEGAKLLPEEPANVVQQQGNEFIAIGVGTVHVLHENKIKAITVTKPGEHFEIAASEPVSTAVITAADLGLSAAADLTIETPANPNFYVGQLEGKIVAYSKLTGSTTGSYEFVVKAQDSGDRTVVRLTDAGTAALTHAVAKVDNVTFNNAATVTIKDPSIARFDKATNTLYLLKEGSTYATADNGHLYAIDVIRNNNQLALLPLEDGTTIDVKPLQITDATNTFTAITETDTTIIELDGNIIHAKALGTTKVKLGDNIITVTIAQNADGQYRMTKAVTSSKLVTFAAAGLNDFKSAEVKAGVADAVSLSLGTDGLTIFSNGAKTAQSLLVHVEDTAGNKTAINVTVDANGAVTAADVVKQTIEDLAIDVTTAETVQTAGARGVWSGKTLTVYALTATDSALKFVNALVNVKATADGNKVNTPTITPLTYDITSIDTATTNAVKKDNPYLLATGSGLIYAGNKVYSVDVKEENNQFVKTISSGVPAVTFDLTTITGTYAEDKSTLTAANVIDYPNEAKKLIVYAKGTGTSELAITDGTNTTIYQTNATASSITEPKAAKLAFTDTSMNNATVIAGDALRVDNDTMYFLNEGNVVLKATDGKLINATVSRDADGYFTATPAYVTKDLKETTTSTTLSGTSKFIADGTKLFVKDISSETFYTANYRVTAKATEANNAYNLEVDERHMVKFNVADYFTSGADTVTANASPSTHAFGEVVGNELIIYAGTTAGQSTVTFTNGTNNVTFNVTHDANGKVTATAQTVVNTLPYADLDLTNGIGIDIAGNSFNSSIVELVKTDAGIAIYPKANGLTSFALTDSTGVIRLVNVKVETVDGAFKVTPTPVTFTAEGTALFTTLEANQVGTTTKHYVTATGTALYGTADENATTTATFINVSKNPDNGYYSVQSSEHTLATITAANLGLDKFEHVSFVGSSVDTKLSTDKKTLYIYGTNNGYTDVLVDDGTNYATIVTSHQNNTLKATPAKKALTELKEASWNTSLVAIRGENMYASHAGKDLATATISSGAGSYKALMNIIVTRKSNQEFDIDNTVIRENVGAATVISGTSVVADGEYIYAQHVGSSVIKVGNEFKTVDVTQSADGLYTLTVGAGFTSNVITAAEAGLTTIDNYKLSAITGTDVVEVQLIDGSAHLFAKKAGEVHLVLSEGTDPNKVQTSVHVLVEEQSGTLSLTPTPSKLELSVEPQFKTTNELFRLSTDKTSIYAIKDGSIFATIGGELHKLTVSNNTLFTVKTRIEAELPGEVTPIDNAILKTDATNKNLVIAKDFGTTNITVDGAEYQVTVKQDGSIEYKKLSTDVIDATTIFKATTVSTVKIGNDSIVGTPAELNNAFIVAATVTDNKITLTPVKAGTATVLISDGTNTIQAQVTVADNNGLKVTHVVPVSKYYTSAVGYYPTAITQPNGTAFTSANGLVTLKDGEITVYPGAIGTAQMIIEGEDDRKGLFELTVTDDDYKFGHFVQTIGYDKFASNPTVLATKGKAKATPGVTGLDVIFEDLNKAFFVVKTTSGYKVVEVQAEVLSNSFEAKDPVIYNALTVTGEVTNVKGLHTIEDGGKTIIYADETTMFPTSYTLDGVIYEVTAGTLPSQLSSSPLSVAATNITAATFMQGVDILKLDSAKWVAKAAGKGIYKITESGSTKYVEIEVKTNGNSYTIEAPQELQQATLTSTLEEVKVNAPVANVYVDETNNTVYGKTTEPIIVSAVDNNKKVLYKGNADFTGFTVVEADVLDALQWTEFTSHTLSATSTLMRIEGTKVFALAPGEELITFKSPNGLERTLKVVVNADYTITITAETPHTLTYSAPNPGFDGEYISFTFSLNIPENVTGLNITLPSNNSDAKVEKNKLQVFITPGIPVTSTFTIIFPELQDQTAQPIKVVTKDLTDYFIANDGNSSILFNLIQP